ncbi:hypothetical protein FRB99_003503 [Tulasnella sp. 403]|nr:hypothetical protein FRB99_003503 [Tulasnella sp. 403]
MRFSTILFAAALVAPILASPLPDLGVSVNAYVSDAAPADAANFGGDFGGDGNSAAWNALIGKLRSLNEKFPLNAHDAKKINSELRDIVKELGIKRGDWKSVPNSQIIEFLQQSDTIFEKLKPSDKKDVMKHIFETEEEYKELHDKYIKNGRKD